jgi:hypothetical protein
LCGCLRQPQTKILQKHAGLCKLCAEIFTVKHCKIFIDECFAKRVRLNVPFSSGIVHFKSLFHQFLKEIFKNQS